MRPLWRTLLLECGLGDPTHSGLQSATQGTRRGHSGPQMEGWESQREEEERKRHKMHNVEIETWFGKSMNENECIEMFSF